MLDLYLENPGLSKEWLIDKQKALEGTYWSLEQELGYLQSQLFSWHDCMREYEEIANDPERWKNFIMNMSLGTANKEGAIDRLGVNVTLLIDNGQKKVHVRCNLGEAILSVVPTTLNSCS